MDVQNVSKWFGNVVAVNDISFQVLPGITGLVGSNGAGKTTLLRMITGLAKPSEGSIRILGQPPRSSPDLYRRVGVMTEQEAVYDVLTGREFVALAAEMHELSDVDAAVGLAIERVGLSDVAGRTLGTYSRGMRQRMRLAVALVNEPELLVLDEPLSGTDPRQRLEFEQLMLEQAAEGRTILISSHVLDEVETLADNILLMVAGKLAASGDFHAIRAKLDEQPYNVRVVSSNARAMAAALISLEAVDSVNVVDQDALVVLSRNVEALQRSIPQIAKEQSIRLLRVEPLDESLESVFGYLAEA
ncbi:MAG: ABC transporter ATP-binding protein [Chloroflexi bacterium]|nr:ABC transporter ATP-binding protein [Chloroflexota bacterium]